MLNWLKQYKWFAAGGLALVVIIAAAVVTKGGDDLSSAHSSVPDEALQSPEKTASLPEDKKNEEKEEIVIDLKGAVKQPGVYEMKAGDRVHHLLKKAGGTVKKADQKQVNLAAILRDGMVVYIPFQGEEASAHSESGSYLAEGEEENTININTASAKELEDIPGVGPSKAEAIVTYREENGPFQTIEDITNVSGIGEKSFEKIKSSISVK
ncbi:helix-hairpin-helix domain-containing protein [Bacillus sp. HSf4]|uniref:helix-hairpin-helix domain-containing protein n=1 Tax=Bacillus sp. HSf4 TaxID=3035514 RepID=UPI0024092C3F|nr:helix-hairpin-helix domain-containing protein [Bacillus sp. HSf4]WFA03789.1 helix-hairpin-helix domain-containing protein [Bacillus sp. HSf4]